MKNLLTALEGRRARDAQGELEASDKEEEEAPAQAAHATGAAYSDDEDDHRAYAEALTVTRKVIKKAKVTVVGLQEVSRAPKHLHGDVPLGGTLNVRASSGRKWTLTTSFNKGLKHLGLARASYLGSDTIQTYGLVDGRMTLARYNPAAPVYLEFAEVGAALTPPEGPPINLGLPDDAEEENPDASDGDEAH
jgi:hypothetical protein